MPRSSSLPWHPYHQDVINWLMLTTWDGEQTLARNIQALVFAHHELVSTIRADAKLLQSRLGGEGAVWEDMCYRYTLRRHLGMLRYAARGAERRQRRLC
ncbi:MAG: hypothetical protein ACO24Y_12465 [Hylemonella sp.]